MRPTDRQGNALSGANQEAVEYYEQAAQVFHLYRGDPFGPLDRALQIAPGFAMAHLLKAHLLATAAEPEATRKAKEVLAEAQKLELDEREASHLAALANIVEGNWTAGAVAFDYHNVRYPHDLLALQTGHLADFYRACSRNLRDRIARVMPRWSSSMPGYSLLLGMYSFGLEETGDYGRAEGTGRQAIALEPLDCWAHHAVAHVMEMQGRAEDGIGWMLTREPYWSGDDNFFKVHNWWHRALFHLDLGQLDEAIALYDGPIRKDRSSVVLDLVDASALLWRLHLAGKDAGDRWPELADAWDAQADGELYAFNDWHAVMAYLATGRDQQVQRLLRALREHPGHSEAAQWARGTGLALAEGFVAFWYRDYDKAVRLLHPARYMANQFGGSNAQRDIIDWTLGEAALRGGLRELAQALAAERLALKPHSRVNLSMRSRAGAGTA